MVCFRWYSFILKITSESNLLIYSVTKKDWEWLMNTMVYGQLFPKASDAERESLRRLGRRWKVRWGSALVLITF